MHRHRRAGARTAAPGYFFGNNERSGALYRLFANVEWQPAAIWVVNGGVMAEHHYYTGLDFSPRLALNYLVSPDHTLRASIGQAYRSPTFFEVDGDVRYFSITGIFLQRFFAPAGDLYPEKVTSRELGYVGHVRPLNLRIDARLFDDSVRDLVGTVDIDPMPGKIFQSTNLNRADICGADIQRRWQPRRDFDLVLNYARVNIDSNDADIADSAPANNFSALGIYRLPGGWEQSAAVYKVGDMKWLDDGDNTENYTRVDARVARRWKWHGHNVELSLVGQNLGNDTYLCRIPPTPDRPHAQQRLRWPGLCGSGRRLVEKTCRRAYKPLLINVFLV